MKKKESNLDVFQKKQLEFLYKVIIEVRNHAHRMSASEIKDIMDLIEYIPGNIIKPYVSEELLVKYLQHMEKQKSSICNAPFSIKTWEKMYLKVK